MWTQLVSFWRWLLGQRTPSSPTEPRTAERRVWIRHVCDIETSIQPLHDSDDVRQSVQVHEISSGGIKLFADRSVEPGSIISVELPGPTEGSKYTVLASVVHVNAQPDGKWALGCSFTQELSENDLQSFGVKRVPAAASDRRNYERFPCKSSASYQRVNDPEKKQHHAEVFDLSPTGVGLRVTQEVEAGQLLHLDLHDSYGKSEITILALVVRVSAQDKSGWVVGCSFIRELSHDELNVLLARRDGSS